MRILWSSNAPWVRTGYGVQTRLTCERLHQSEQHDIAAIFGWYGAEGSGNSLNWNGIPVLARHPNSHPYGADLLANYAQRYKADIAITLIDAWVQEPSMIPPNVRWVPYFPVDHDPIPPLVADKVSKAFARISYSKFGVEKLKEAGLDAFYVPHMVDTKAFFPVGKAEARASLGLPQDKFIVGMVAANKGFPSRKSFPECIEAFADFLKQVPNALLWLHTNIGGNDNMGGVDLKALIQQFNIGNSTIVVSPMEYNCGLDDTFMRNLYSSFDVFLNPAMGEGFGVPIVEAQACGTPVISGNWTAQTEVCADTSINVGTGEADRIWTPQMSFQWRPKPEAILRKLLQVFRMDAIDYDALSRKCRDFVVENYDADLVTQCHWLPVLDRIAERVNGANALQSRFMQATGRAAA
jgi:glycosyltransferase involved in cell wall biosynthesis